MPLSLSEQEEIEALWPGWVKPWDGGTEPPPVPDWLVSLILADDLHVSIFALEQLPMEEPFVTIVKGWALIRREAQGLTAQKQAAARPPATS